MTPEREKYLAKCSDKENFIRANITYYKQQLRSLKMAKLTIIGDKYWRGHIRHTKCHLNAYRHELARLKGMDRVTYPCRIMLNNGDYIVGLWRCSSCSDGLCEGDNYCTGCGRKILWKRFK